MKSTMIDVTGADRTGVPCVACGAPTAMICDGCREAYACGDADATGALAP